MTLEVDSVILAIGQRPDLDFITDADGIELGPAGHPSHRPEDPGDHGARRVRGR